MGQSMTSSVTDVVLSQTV